MRNKKWSRVLAWMTGHVHRGELDFEERPSTLHPRYLPFENAGPQLYGERRLNFKKSQA